MENDDFTTERPKDVYVEHASPGLDYVYDTKGGELLWIVNYELPEDIWNEGENTPVITNKINSNVTKDTKRTDRGE